MRILLIGASGMIGSRVAAETRDRGHEVTGATRSGADGTEKADASDTAAIAALAAGKDAVVFSISAGRDGTPAEGPLLAAGRAVLDAMRQAGVRRLFVVGGAGSLEVAPSVRLIDTPEFPEIYKNEALAQCALLDVIRAEAEDLDWTYISPAAEIQPGERTGTYRRGVGRLVTDAEGRSEISAEDFAIGLVDELEKGAAADRHITFAH
ncbi:NAD(P)H-binding protein [Actinoallomurus bryophytorum]|uniref:NAD(P)-binding domain-containing protein n=1 Tax=Actinoallomurus bryophytorum TaxID=1490222 RepID=A0A543CIS2_9ACTN|nr:NAD(P)H-binding protein [Actinoallomurus bryophytorum]TQL96940.1 hypothetical protein FB559_2493 [Actinoallomurus bryophytorum]